VKAYYEKRSYPTILPLRIYRHVHKSFSFHAHWHSDIELVLVREGTLRFGVNHDIRTLHQGELAICCSGDIHFYDSAGATASFDILLFQPSLIGCQGNWPDGIRFDHSFISRAVLEENGIPGAVMERIQDIIQSLYEEMRACEPSYELFATSLVMELCGLLQRKLPSSPIDPKKENKRLASLSTTREIINYLETNYMKPLTLAETASHFNISTFHFCRLFQSLAGTHFKEYLNAVRIDAAEEQIRSGALPITTIALECGFNNIRTFNRVFKAIKGCTPSSLRS
jgi:AraC-like DNA-binding protein